AFGLAVVVSFVAVVARAQPVGPIFSRDAIGEKHYPAAPRIESQTLTPAVVLPSASRVRPEALDEMRQWNKNPNVPVKNGFVRPTVDPIVVTIGDHATRSGRGVVAETSR